MIEGQFIRLRVWREDDLPSLTALRNDFALQSQLMARARGSNAEQVLTWLKDRTDRLFFVIADRGSDAALGYLQIADLGVVDRHADLGICLARRARGSGLGGEAINLVCDYLVNTWDLRKLCLRVRADNAAALRCYEKAGFEHCGVLRQHVCFDGRWLDVVMMERFLASGSR